MTAIRRPLLGLLALFVGALSLDRLALAAPGTRTIGTAAYLAALCLVGAPLMIRTIRRARFATFTVAAAGAATLSAVVGGRLTADPYDALVEAAFATLAAALAHRLATGLASLDSTINTVVFGDSPALPLDGPRAANEILDEMARSRRHGRPLSVTVLAPDPDSLDVAVDHAGEEVQRAVRARYVHSELARVIAGQLRRSDLLFEDPATGHFVVVSPETSAVGTHLLVDRIKLAVGPTRVRLSAGQATFPEHALTFEQLVERAQGHMDDPSDRPGPTHVDAHEGAA